MRLVHHHHRGWIARDELTELAGFETFRGDVENPDRAPRRVAQDALLLLRRNGAVHAGGRHAPLRQRVHLILHQGDERGDHQSIPGTHQDRQLVAQGFARPRRHDHAQVGPREDLADHLLLSVKKAGESEIFFQCLVHNPCEYTLRGRHVNGGDRKSCGTTEAKHMFSIKD